MSTVKIAQPGVATGPEVAAARPAPKGRRLSADGVFGGFSHLFLFAWGAMVVFPLLWVVLSSFKDDAQILKEPLSLIPKSLHWGNFARAWGDGHIGAFFLNTVIIVGGGVFLTMLLGSMAAYVLARYEFPGNRVIYFLFLAGLSLPIYLAAVPLYEGVNRAGTISPLLGRNQYKIGRASCRDRR